MIPARIRWVGIPAPPRSCSSAGQSVGGRRRRRGRGARRSGCTAPRCVSCPGCRLAARVRHCPAPSRSSASRCRCRTWWLTKTGPVHSPHIRRFPDRCSSLSGLLKGVSVDAVRSTEYCWGVKSCRHSASVWLTSNVPLDVLGAPAAVEFSSDTPPASTPRPAVPSSMRRRVKAGRGRDGVGSVMLPTVRGRRQYPPDLGSWHPGDGPARRTANARLHTLPGPAVRLLLWWLRSAVPQPRRVRGDRRTV